VRKDISSHPGQGPDSKACLNDTKSPEYLCLLMQNAVQVTPNLRSSKMRNK